MPYTKLVGGKPNGSFFSERQPGVAEDFINEAEWRSYLEELRQQNPMAGIMNPEPISATMDTPHYRFLQEMKKPAFPIAVFIQAGRKNPEVGLLLNLVLTGLTGMFSEQFLATQFKELMTLITTNATTLPQFTPSQMAVLERALQDAGFNPVLFLGAR